MIITVPTIGTSLYLGSNGEIKRPYLYSKNNPGIDISTGEFADYGESAPITMSPISISMDNHNNEYINDMEKRHLPSRGDLSGIMRISGNDYNLMLNINLIATDDLCKSIIDFAKLRIFPTIKIAPYIYDHFTLDLNSTLDSKKTSTQWNKEICAFVGIESYDICYDISV